MTDPDADLIEAMARAIAAQCGYEWGTLYESKRDWTRDGGKRHDINVPYKPDWLEAARAALAVARRRIWREAMEAAAKEADAEELTGDPPTDWNMDTIIAVQATVIATKCSIVCAIRALTPPSAEPHNVGKSVESSTE